MKHFLVTAASWLGGLVLLLAASLPQAQGQAYSSCGAKDPGGNPQQAGAYAEYYAGYFNDSPAFFTTKAPGLTRVDAQVNFTSTNTWGTAGSIVPPAGGSSAAPTNFSVRERGEIYLPQAGDYTFYLTSDDGSFLWLDGEAALQVPRTSTATINNGGNHASRLVQQTVTGLAAGWHNFQLLYGDSGGDNNLVLQYSGPGIGNGTTATTIPNSALCTGIRLAPTSLVYSPALQTTGYQVAVSSGAPMLGNNNSTSAVYSLLAGSTLPAGITVNPGSGVLTADATVAPGTYSVSVTATNDAGATTFADAFTFVVNAPCGGLDPYGNAAQLGLLAEYYPKYFNDQLSFFANNAAFALGTTQNPARIKRVETSINYPGNGTWQASGLNLYSAGVAGTSDAVPDNFSARYRGKVYISTPGDYIFTLISDDASYLVIDGSAAAQTQAAPYTINNGGGHGTTTVNSAATTLSVGWHDLVLLYGNGQTNSYLSLQYSGPGFSQQVIPGNLLCTGIVSVPTGLAYPAASTTYPAGNAASSGAPTVYSANATAAPFSYAIANAAGSLPGGISIDPATGVLSADATVVPGAYPVNVAVTSTTSYATDAATFPAVFVFNVLAPGCTGSDAGGNAAQSGLYSEYYSGYFGAATGADTDANLTYFTDNQPLLVTNTPSLNFTANNAWQTSGLNLYSLGVASNSDAVPTKFSARYRGRLYIGQEGDYTFYLASDDAAYLFLDAAATASPLTIASATINSGGAHTAATKTGTKHLLPGLHDLQVLYGQDPGDSYLTLQYSGVSSTTTIVSQQVIPATVLCSSSSARPLPVVLLRFEASAVGQAVQLDWATVSELSSARFEVERSADGVTFGKVGEVAAAGSSSQARQYQYLDRAPLPGLAYYRLRQVDLDGSAHYSLVAPVQRAAGAAPLLTLAPNPSTGQVTVQLVQPGSPATTLQVLDALGREVYRQVLPATTQPQDVDLRTLPAGVYLVRTSSVAGVATQRLVRQ